MFSPSSPVTGSAVTGLTTPTYTLASDSAPSNFSKQWTVSALGGTQSGVTVHSIQYPFTLTAFRPSKLKILPPVNQTTGKVLGNVPQNTYRVLVRTGGPVDVSGANSAVASLDIRLNVPAGFESYSLTQLKAMLSLGLGSLVNQVDGLVTTSVVGSI